MNRELVTLVFALTVFSPWVHAAEAVFGPAREIVGAHAGTVIEFPDVAHRPVPGALPPGVPIPYPNIGRPSDTERGDTAQPLTNRSYFERALSSEDGHGADECETPARAPRARGYFELPDVVHETPRVVRYPDPILSRY